MPGIPNGEFADEVAADYARLNKLDDERRYNDEQRRRNATRVEDPWFKATAERYARNKIPPHLRHLKK